MKEVHAVARYREGFVGELAVVHHAAVSQRMVAPQKNNTLLRTQRNRKQVLGVDEPGVYECNVSHSGTDRFDGTVTVVGNFDVYPDARGGRSGERFSLWDEIDIDFARHDQSDALSNASATSRVRGAFEAFHRDRAFLEECLAGVGERNLTTGTEEERDAQIDLQF